MRITAAVRVHSRLRLTSQRIDRAIQDGVKDLAKEVRKRAQQIVPVDTGALRASIYIDDYSGSGRESARSAALARLELAKRQYIAFHRARGRNNPKVNVRGRRSVMPHTLPEEVGRHFIRGARRGEYGFGMPRVGANRYRAQVIAGMHYASYVEYPTRRRAGRFFMRRSAQYVSRMSRTIMNERIRRVLT